MSSCHPPKRYRRVTGGFAAGAIRATQAITDAREHFRKFKGLYG
jgi:hypothetical protein